MGADAKKEEVDHSHEVSEGSEARLLTAVSPPSFPWRRLVILELFAGILPGAVAASNLNLQAQALEMFWYR